MAKKQLKKEWYPIIAPKLFRNATIGETTVFDPQDMVGKELSTNLMTLTGNARNQNVKVNFQIKKVADNKGQAEVTGYKMVNSSIKRMVRRNVEKVDDSFIVESKDNVKLRVKPIIIARRTTAGSVATAIRKSAQAAIMKHAKELNFDAFAGDVVYHKLQDQLKRSLSKVYPIKMCEIKYMGIADKREVEAEEAKAAEVKPAVDATEAPKAEN